MGRVLVYRLISDSTISSARCSSSRLRQTDSQKVTAWNQRFKLLDLLDGCCNFGKLFWRSRCVVQFSEGQFVWIAPQGESCLSRGETTQSDVSLPAHYMNSFHYRMIDDQDTCMVRWNVELQSKQCHCGYISEPTCAFCTVGPYAPLSVCQSGFVRPTLCTTSMVLDCVVRLSKVEMYACHISISQGGLTANVKLHFSFLPVYLLSCRLFFWD